MSNLLNRGVPQVPCADLEYRYVFVHRNIPMRNMAKVKPKFIWIDSFAQCSFRELRMSKLSHLINDDIDTSSGQHLFL